MDGLDDDSLLGMLDSIDTEEAAETSKITDQISDVYLWVLCALGIPGNIFTIFSILTMNKTSSATFFVALLACCDGLALLAKLIGHHIYSDKIYVGDIGCKLQFIPMFLSAMANWALVLITLERFFSVCFPLKKAYLFTKKRSYIIAGIISVLLFVIYGVIHCFFYTADSSGFQCGVKSKYSDFFFNTWRWIQATLFLFVPFLITIGFTTCIIRGLSVSRKQRRSMFAGDGAKSGQSTSNANNKKLIDQTERAERMITIMLILAAVLFVIMALPACIFHLFYNHKEDDPEKKANQNLFKQCSYVLLDSTHAINFFLYFISAKRFRNHFISIVTCKAFPRKSGHSANSNTANTASTLSTST